MPDHWWASHRSPIQFELFYFDFSYSYLPLPIGIDDPSRPFWGALRVWFKVFNDSDLSLMRGYVAIASIGGRIQLKRLFAIPLYSLKNSAVEVLTITLYKHYPCRGYTLYKEGLITDLMSSHSRFKECLYKDDLFGSTLFCKVTLIFNCRYSL